MPRQGRESTPGDEPFTKRAHERSVYDCLYVALALEEDCEFVTADQSLIRALGGTFPFIIGSSKARP
jgi:predicted nucleic acid-binding protein